MMGPASRSVSLPRGRDGMAVCGSQRQCCALGGRMRRQHDEMVDRNRHRDPGAGDQIGMNVTASLAPGPRGPSPPGSRRPSATRTHLAPTRVWLRRAAHPGARKSRHLVSLLEQNPLEGRGWVGLRDIETGQIAYRECVEDGAVPRPSSSAQARVLERAGDACSSCSRPGPPLSSNQYGTAHGQGYSGNPLTPPVLLSSPVYTGTPAGYSPSNITKIRTSTTIIKQYILNDPNTGQLYPKPPGIDRKPGPYQGGSTPPPTATTPTSPTTTATGTSSTSNTPPQENPAGSRSPNPVTAGDTVTLRRRASPRTNLAIDFNRPEAEPTTFIRRC